MPEQQTFWGPDFINLSVHFHKFLKVSPDRRRQRWPEMGVVTDVPQDPDVAQRYGDISDLDTICSNGLQVQPLPIPIPSNTHSD
jgi:hypothetical protein